MTHVPLDYDILNRRPKFKIGLVKTLSKMPASKPNSRAVVETAEMLRGKGNEVVEVELPNLDKYFKYLQNSVICDQ